VQKQLNALGSFVYLLLIIAFLFFFANEEFLFSHQFLVLEHPSVGLLLCVY